MRKDITDLVDFGDIDGELLPLTECICGRRFSPWDFVLTVYPDKPKECPSCGRKLYFEFSIRVFEISDQTPTGDKSKATPRAL